VCVREEVKRELKEAGIDIADVVKKYPKI